MFKLLNLNPFTPREIRDRRERINREREARMYRDKAEIATVELFVGPTPLVPVLATTETTLEERIAEGMRDPTLPPDTTGPMPLTRPRAGEDERAEWDRVNTSDRWE